MTHNELNRLDELMEAQRGRDRATADLELTKLLYAFYMHYRDDLEVTDGEVDASLLDGHIPT